MVTKKPVFIDSKIGEAKDGKMAHFNVISKCKKRVKIVELAK